MTTKISLTNDFGDFYVWRMIVSKNMRPEFYSFFHERWVFPSEANYGMIDANLAVGEHRKKFKKDKKS